MPDYIRDNLALKGEQMEGFRMPNFALIGDAGAPLPNIPDLSINNVSTPAQLFFERLRDVIKTREAEIGDSQELVWTLICQNGKEYRVSMISYENPSLIHFYVVDDIDEPCEIFVNVAQVQFILKAINLSSGEPKRKIGFIQRDISS